MQLIYQHGVYAPLDASEDFTPVSYTHLTLPTT